MSNDRGWLSLPISVAFVSPVPPLQVDRLETFGGIPFNYGRNARILGPVAAQGDVPRSALPFALMLIWDRCCVDSEMVTVRGCLQMRYPEQA